MSTAADKNAILIPCQPSHLEIRRGRTASSQSQHFPCEDLKTPLKQALTVPAGPRTGAGGAGAPVSWAGAALLGRAPLTALIG